MRPSHFALRILAVSFIFATSSPHAASDAECRAYAYRAIDQYRAMMSRPKCKMAADARWQDSFPSHYEWCRTAPTASHRSEEKARDARLYQCGAQKRID